MEHIKIETLLKIIGKKIQQQRLKKGFEAEDIAEMTGLTAPTIRKIENGNETHLSNFLAVCLAINMHPKEVFNVEVSLEPLFELSNTRKEKTRLTARIDYFIENNYFNQDRTTRDVVNELSDKFDIKTNTSAVSVILNRKVDGGELKAMSMEKVKIYKKR